MSLVSVDISSGGIATLTLNRADKLNAFSAAMMKDFLSVLGSLHQKAQSFEVRAVLICSAASPKAFCVGADLTERMAMSEVQVSDTLALQRKIMDSVAALPVPTIAVIDGAAFGGGLELALACDLRVASPTAQMGLTETGLAIIPGAGGTQRLTKLIGPAKAKELIFLAKRLQAGNALILGLVNEVAVDPLKAAQQWGESIAKAGPLAIPAAKEAIDGGQSLPLEEALNLERSCYEKVLHSQDRVEGLKAFAEKRPPVYKAR